MGPRAQGTRGISNGLINGESRRNGFINGRGRGAGLTNGTGYTNGLPLHRNVFGVVSHGDLRRSAAIIGVSLLLMLSLGYYFGTPPPTPSPFAVDGDFSEWSDVAMNTDPQDVGPSDTDLVAFAVHAAPEGLFVYGRTRTPLFQSTVPSAIYVLVDDPTTSGYEGPALSVDFVAELVGWDNATQGTSLREWPGASDPHNATAFRARGAFPAISVTDEFELVLDADLLRNSPDNLRLRIVAPGTDGVDYGAIVSPDPGALVVDQRRLLDVLVGPAPVLELRLSALGADVVVNTISFQQGGGGTVSTLPLPMTIRAGEERVEQVALAPGSVPAGTLVSLSVGAVDATVVGSSRAPVTTISGNGARAYVQGPPSPDKIIDGVFSDWATIATDPDDPLPGNVDLREYSFSMGSDAFFYVGTERDALGGVILPERLLKATAPGPPGNVTVVPVGRVAGEDVLWIYVDADDRDTRGQPIGGIFADRWIDVRGRLGRITSVSLLAWDEATWTWTPRSETLDSFVVGAQFEASAPLSFLGPANNPRVVYMISDWSARGDSGAALGPQAAPPPPAMVGPLHGLLPDNIRAPPLVNIPTVDGRCPTFFGEYDGGATDSNADLTLRVGRRDDIQFVFVCVTATSDVTNDFFDFGEIMFDTLHDGGLAPQKDDRLFAVFTQNAPFFDSYQGDGTTWVFPCGDCDGGNYAEGDFRNGHENYEFMIRYTDVWGSLTPPPDAVAGFAVVVWDDSVPAIYTWGSAGVSDFQPETWGHIVIPEFSVPGLAAVVAVLTPVVLRHRRATSRRR